MYFDVIFYFLLGGFVPATRFWCLGLRIWHGVIGTLPCLFVTIQTEWKITSHPPGEFRFEAYSSAQEHTHPPKSMSDLPGDGGWRLLELNSAVLSVDTALCGQGTVDSIFGVRNVATMVCSGETPCLGTWGSGQPWALEGAETGQQAGKWMLCLSSVVALCVVGCIAFVFASALCACLCVCVCVCIFVGCRYLRESW